MSVMDKSRIFDKIESQYKEIVDSYYNEMSRIADLSQDELADDEREMEIADIMAMRNGKIYRMISDIFQNKV